jgi:hypothetical protein
MIFLHYTDRVVTAGCCYCCISCECLADDPNSADVHIVLYVEKLLLVHFTKSQETRRN